MPDSSLTACPSCGSRYRGRLERCPFDGATLEPATDAWVGRTVGERFTLGEAIGVGAIGSVHRADDTTTGRTVALKVLHTDLSRAPEHRERFQRESRAIMRVEHPAIVHVLATSALEEERPWFAMTLYEGVPLREALGGGAVDPARARRLVERLAEALAVAHGAGIVHRDLKASNVLVSRSLEGEPVILDFGLASVQGEPGLTETGELIGSPETMSPEQIRGAAPCPSMDHYALGCLWFELVTGRPPFVGKTSAVLDGHLRVTPPATETLGARVPEPDAELLYGLLSKVPEGRTKAFAALVAVP